MLLANSTALNLSSSRAKHNQFAGSGALPALFGGSPYGLLALALALAHLFCKKWSGGTVHIGK